MFVVAKGFLVSWILLGLTYEGKAQWDCANVFTRHYNGTYSRACPRNFFGPEICFDCLPWANVTDKKYGPKDNASTDLVENYCRFVGDKRGPGCYYQTPDGDIDFKFCGVPPCHAHSGCLEGDGADYRDLAMYTESGYSCLEWSQMTEQDVNPTSYPDAGLDKNYCRNPNNMTRPWCYYRDQDMQIRTDFCPIDTCKYDVLPKFQRYYKTYIPSNNRKYHRGSWWDMTAEDCAKFCLEEETFVCRSFEYREEYYYDDRRCILTDQSLHTLDIYRTTTTGTAIDLFTRINTVCDAYQANKVPDGCPLQLGMEDGTIPDSYITASSSSDPHHLPEHARLGGPSYWRPAQNSSGTHWLQVCFPQRMLISGVVTQGGGQGEEAGWVEDFELEYTQGEDVWWKYRDFQEFDLEPLVMVFRANGEADCHRPIILPSPVRAKCVRIIPTLWNHAPHLRIDLIGCQDNDCDTVLGLSDGRVLGSQLTSSSNANETYAAETARLNPLHQQPSTGWVPDVSDRSQWLLVDLRRSHEVRAVLTQGCGDRELWVTAFQMFYGDLADASDSNGLEQYLDQNGNLKEFTANSDRHTIVRNDLVPQIVTRYVRINPVLWHPAGICLRLELVGCMHRACGQRLGMESGVITDNQLSASSSYSSRPKQMGRLHYELGISPGIRGYSCWGPKHELGLSEWLEADLGALHTITGAITQGAGDTLQYYWVEEYKLQWLSTHQEGVYLTYKDLEGNDMIFRGNRDQNSEVRNDLDRPFITRRVRIVPHSWHNITACLRVEFLGCPLEGTGRICGLLELGGYCMGSINNQSPTACGEIFSQGSHSLIVSSAELQQQLWQNRNQLLIEYQRKYVIGLSLRHSLGEDSYRWVDGTPLTYSNIRWPLDSYDDSVDHCVSMDADDLFYWREEDCVSDVSKAQICQIDIDECISDSHGCSHDCVNVPGSYYCECPQGYRLNDTDLRTCSDICDWQEPGLTPIQFLGGGNSCYGTFSHNANWTEAFVACGGVDGHLPYVNDSVFFWLDTTWENLFSWALVDVDDLNVERSCHAVRTDGGNVTIKDAICSDELPFICRKEYEDVKCNSLWASNTSSSETRATEGYIQSLSYAPWYDAGSMCTIHIRGPEIYRVRFLISRMTLRKETPEDSQISRCVDLLEITDNIPGVGPYRRGRYCGTLRDVEVVTRSNNVTVVFTIGQLSAGMPRELGFVASYKLINCSKEDCNTDCGTDSTLLTAPSGSLATRDFPARLPPFSTCLWRIRLPKGSFIRLTFPDFRVVRDSGTGQCVDSVLVVRSDEGEVDMTDRGELSEELCGTAPPQILSESEELLIVYQTELDVLSEGFMASYSTTALPGCGVGLQAVSEYYDCVAPAAVLASPQHPLPYPANSKYSWRISTPRATYIRLTFGDFDVPSSNPTCDQDHMEIFNGEEDLDGELLGEYCNAKRPPHEVLSSMNQMLVVFESYAPTEARGFTATYRAIHFKPRMSLESPYDTDYSCESGWAEYFGYCYHFHAENTTVRWTDAERLCEIEGALLTSIRDFGEMNFLHFMLTSDWFMEETATYIGLTDLQQEGHFRWVDGRPLSYADWNANGDGFSQPDGGLLEACSVIKMRSLHSTQNWEDIPCSLRAAKQFICKKPAEMPDGTKPNISKPLDELHSKECDDGWWLAGDVCTNLTLMHNELPVTPGPTTSRPYAPLDSPDCQTDVQVTSDLLSAVFYLIKHVWDNESLRQEGFLVGVGRRELGGLLWELGGSVAESDHGECEGVAYTDGQWVLEHDIPCDAPVSAVVCYQPAREVFQQCDESMFPCASGECIQQVYVCDRVADCTDASDERICEDDVSVAVDCEEGFFHCARGGCISVSFLCDFIPQCVDGSDEEHCEYPECPESKFQCDIGQCIDEEDHCNLRVDCLDGSDEINCDTCKSAFQCYDSSCIPHYAECDATQDCPGFIREDEVGCASDRQCSTDQLQCNSGACADMSHWCIYDFDEFGYQTGCRDVTHLRFCEHFTCSAFTYKCPRSYCIPLHRRCDGVYDCPNGEDELSCEEFVCPENTYKCRNDRVCLTEDQVCNGAAECPRGDDELFCDVICPDGCQCTGLSFVCQGTRWNQTKADSLPDDLRRLVLSQVTVEGTTPRRRRETSPGTTLANSLFIQLQRFDFLYDLDISGNGIEILEPGMFSQQRNLFSLSVANNRLQSLSPGTFEGLRWLQELNISGNPLVTIQSGAFQHLHSLPYLDLHGLEIRHVYPGSFRGMGSLQKLDLSDNNLSELETGTFGNLSDVRVLDISSNSLEVFKQDLFFGLTSLQTLHSDKYLFCCMVGGIEECTPEPDQFSSCEDLMRNHVLRVFIWILGLSAFLGNSFVVVWRLCTKQRFKVQGLLILNLALSDCLMGVYMLIIAGADVHYRDVYIYHADKWKSGVLCKIAGFLSAFSSEASVFMLTVITLDRFLCIMFPFRQVKLGPKSVKFVIAAGWVFAFLLAVVPALGLPYFGEQYYGRSSVCLALPLTGERTPGWEYSIIVFLGVNLVSIITILVCYIAIYVYAKRSAKQIRSTKGASKELKLATKTFLIVATDMCCWFPIVIMGYLSLSGSAAIPPTVYAWTAVFILPINSSINPYLYTISSIALPKLIEVSHQARSQRCQCQESGHKNEMALGAVRSNGHSHTVTTPLHSPLTRRKAPSSGRFLLSSLLSGDIYPTPRLHNSDLKSVESDLMQALKTLHEKGLCLAESVEAAVVLDKEPAETEWHASLLLPRTVPAKLPTPLDEDIVHQDEQKLETVFQRIKDKLSTASPSRLSVSLT